MEGSLKDCRNGAVVVLGTGVGGGIIIDHKLYREGILQPVNTVIY